MSDQIQPNDGGPAFPIPGFNADTENPGKLYFPEGGMSLRDYFAGQAVIGIVGDTIFRTTASENIAGWSYQIADAMLKARERKP